MKTGTTFFYCDIVCDIVCVIIVTEIATILKYPKTRNTFLFPINSSLRQWAFFLMRGKMQTTSFSLCKEKVRVPLKPTEIIVF